MWAVFTAVTELLSSDATTEDVDTTLILDGGNFGAWSVIGGGLFLPPGGLLLPGTTTTPCGVTTSSGLASSSFEAASSAGSVDRGRVTVGVCEDFRILRGWIGARLGKSLAEDGGVAGGSLTWSWRPRKLRFLRRGVAVAIAGGRKLTPDT